MNHPEECPFPLDFAAVCGGPAHLEVVHFEAGAPVDSPRNGIRLVLHAGADSRALEGWAASGAVCAPARRLLALLAPEEPEPALRDALDLGTRYVHAALGVRSESEVLRWAAEVLPATAGA